MTISSTSRKAGPYIGSGAAATFPFAFKVFSTSDIEVVRLEVSTTLETVLVLTADYTAILNADQNSNPGGSITLVAGPLAAGFNLVLTSDVANLQGTDLTNQGGFYPEVINDSLDRATIQIQQLQEEVDRSAKLPITSAEDANALVADIVRLADSADNLDTDAINIGSINTVAAAISNVNTVATNIASVNSVAGNATNINAVNSNSTNINAVNSNSSNINTVAGNNTNITTVAGISANVTSVAGNSTNINAVASNSTNINAVAGNATNINAVNANSTNINTVATNNTAINSVYTNMTAVTSAYTNLAAIIDAPTQAAAAASSASAAAASAASGMYSAVQDKSADYTIVAGDAGDLIRVSTGSGAVTITLPTISTVGDGFKIAVVKWTSDANAVNIARSGSDTINGATSAQIGSQYSQIILVADAETSTWFASQSGLGATNVNIDNFSGNGSTTAFTLTSDPSTENNTAVYISGVYQQKNTYSVSGTTLTFSTAPPTGTANIEVAYSTPLAIGTPSDGTVTTAKLVDANVTPAKLDRSYVVQDSATGAAQLPSGTTAQRPASPANGYTRFNTTLGYPEWYSATAAVWVPFNVGVPYTISYLVVAGGGAGGWAYSGGGGAGGMQSSTALLNKGVTYAVTVGAGGTGGTSGAQSTAGASSSLAGNGITTITSIGGGGGAGANGTNIQSGGSGGGGVGYAGGSNGAAGTSGQGNSGAAGGSSGGGGGGGAGAAGNIGQTTSNGNGGAGAASSITGTSVTYAGGGGGGQTSPSAAGTGGAGGGGAGTNNASTGGAGTANTGGGGGGGGTTGGTYGNGGNGGSGIVILSIPTASYSGQTTGSPTVTTSGANTILSFTSSGTYTA
jgi:hypothetical protein